MNQFRSLFLEVDKIRELYGYDMLDALEHIRDNLYDYNGTQTGKEFREFFKQGQLMFAAV